MVDFLKAKRNNSVRRLFAIGLIVVILLYLHMTFVRPRLNVWTTRFAGSEDRRTAGESLADRLYREVRLMCLVMTSPQYHDERAVHVLRTWGRHCNGLLFMSSEEHGELESVPLNVPEGPEHLWAKVRSALSYVQRYKSTQADWFLRVDDDTFVVVENLRALLQPYDPQDPLYFGCKLSPFGQHAYMSGGAGYVLSREALRRFVSHALPDATNCRHESTAPEDVEMGRCLHGVGVRAIDTNLTDGASFLPLSLSEHVNGINELPSWLPDYNISQKVSKRAISFHHVRPFKMYSMEYLIYKLRLFGVHPAERNG